MTSTKKKPCYDKKYQSKEKDDAWEEYFKTRSVESRNRLVKLYYNYVCVIANGTVKKIPKYAKTEVNDLIAEGVIALMDKLETFDPKKCDCFLGYAVGRIRGAMKDYLRHVDDVPRLTRRRMRKMNGAIGVLEVVLGHIPDDDELMDYLDVDEQEYMLIKNGSAAPCKLPLDMRVGDDRESIGARVCVENVDNYYDRLDREEALVVLSTHFSKRDTMVLILRYFENMMMNEIGTAIGVSESRVSQIHADIINRLRRDTDLLNNLLEHIR